MNNIPAELITIINNYLDTENQLNFKHTCKRFYDVIPNNHIKLQDVTKQYLFTKQITEKDLIKYVIQQNGSSISNIVKFIDDMQTKKTIVSEHCIHTPVRASYYTDYHIIKCDSKWCSNDRCPYECNEYVYCQLCGIEWACDSCCEASDYSAYHNAFHYGKTKCKCCDTIVMSYMCLMCGDMPYLCQC